jgi:hypothetical protein
MKRNRSWRGASRVRGSGNAAHGDGRSSPAILFLSGLFFAAEAKVARSSSCLSCDERLFG